jgi:hypothetical protein
VKTPVLIYLDFVAGKWSRYLGRSRTMHGAFVDQPEAVLRTLDWHAVLHAMRYAPWELDPDAPRDPVAA